jgi:hypothetical protein
VLVKALREYVPSAAAFDGVSVSKTDYQSWSLPPRFRHEKAKYVANETPFEKTTSYTSNFTAKSAERYIHPKATYAPLSTAKFDAKSTNKTDFLGQRAERVKDFAPRNVYEAKADDRDFVSTMRGAHTTKPMPTCPAAEYARATAVHI